MRQDLDILTLGLPEAWNMYKILTNKDNTYREIRFGKLIKFDINNYLKNRLIVKPKIGKIIIKGRTIDLEEFETELEDREKDIKNWLLENYKEEELISPRGLK